MKFQDRPRFRKRSLLVLFALVGLGAAATNATAQTTFYTDRSAFVAALDPTYGLIHESFENDSVWGSVRSTIVGGSMTATSITHRGLTWTSNNLSSAVTTGVGAARTGEWGFYSLPHGSYLAPDPGSDCFTPGDCGDGFRINSGTNLMYALGGFVRTNTPFAKVGLFEDAYTFGGLCNTIDCDDVTIGTGSQFVGVIAPDGFTRIEFRELEGKREGSFGGDLKYIFADDFIIAVDASLVPVPPALLLFAPSVVALAGLGRRSHRSTADGRREPG